MAENILIMTTLVQLRAHFILLCAQFLIRIALSMRAVFGLVRLIHTL